MRFRSIAFIVLLGTAGLHSQSRNADHDKVIAAISAGRGEDALSLLTKLLEKKPTDVSLLRVRMNILLGLRRNWEAMGCAQELVEVLPDGLEKESLRAYAALSRRTRGELQSLIERAVMYRTQRKPKELLEV